ncbi:2,3-bisphosphoglycerate-dependent phosphoglycerate mutase, partial [Candidatus Poribacteria bacterium]|nr:2,3-bisphosphoglycerate-dependent phosphoglycerate mutase [Candidatus Poribacteria bacterium]
MAFLVLLRHGESQWNLENRFTGWVDVDLSPKGELEAREAGAKLASYRFDKVYTSVLKRAIRTADIALEVAKQANLPTERDQALNERHYGDLQGLNKAETAQKFGDEQVHIWRRSFDVRPPNGESLKDTAERVMPYWEAHILPDLKAGN